MRVVAAMIVRNEAGNLEDLFESAKGLVDEWVVLDTGSTDNTMEVAEHLGATVFQNEWDDDFARSRNVGLKAIEKSYPPDTWVVILDGDDRVENPLALRKELEAAGPQQFLYALNVFSPTPEGVETICQVRVWRVCMGIRYHHPIHAAPNLEFLKDTEGNVSALQRLESGAVRHLGYETEEGRKRNALRTLRICRSKLPPDDPHRLACECRALATLGDWESAFNASMKAIAWIRKRASEGGAQSLNVQPYLIASRALILNGNPATAILLLAECVQHGGAYHPDLWGNFIQSAAFGLLGAALVGSQSGELNTASAQAYDILTALNTSGILGDGIPKETLETLRKHKEDSTGSLVYSRRVSDQGWDTARPTPPYAGNFPGPEGAKRVLVVGDFEIASQVSTLSQAINDHTPHVSVSCIFTSDYIHSQRGENSVVLDKDGEEGLERLKALAGEADLVHFIRFPTDASDICWGDFLGPTNTLIQYMGTQLRENADTFMEWHEATGVLGVVAWDYTLLEKGWMPYHVPLAYSGAGTLPETVHPLNRLGGPLRVCHAPTRRGFKKTDLFLKVCQELVDEGHEIEPVLIEGVSNEECLAIKASCHVTYDQLSVGVHGMSAVESMALNHIVVAGISNWALSVHPGVPILRATESTLKDILGSLCTREVYKNELNRLQPVAWAKQMHHPAVVIQRLSYLYDLVWNGHRLLP